MHSVVAELEAFVQLSVTAALAKVAELEGALKKATTASLNLTGAGATGAGIAPATAAVDGLNRSAAATYQTFQRLTSVGTQMSKYVTVPILGAATASVALATSFDASITKLSTLAGVPAAQLNDIKQSLLDLAPVVGVVPKELSDGLFIVASSGIKGAQALDVLKAAAEGSAIGLGETSKIAGAVTTVLNAYPGGLVTATQATNVLVAATREGKVQADEFAGQLGKVIEPAALIGINIGEVSAAVATLTRVTGSASTATTDFAGLLQTLIKPSVQAQKALSDVGLSSQQLLDDIKSHGLLFALNELKTAFGDNTLALGSLFRNRNGLTAFLGLTSDFQKTTGIFNETAKALASSGTDINGFSDVTQTAAFKFKAAKAELEATAISFGETITPGLASAAKGVAGFIGSFKDLPTASKDILEVGLGVAAIGGPLLVGIGQVGKLKAALDNVPAGLQGTVSTITKVTGTAVASLGAFGGAFLAAQSDGATAAAGFVTSALSIGAAFAAGGPIGGAIATVSAVGGAVLGFFEEGKQEAEAFNKKAADLAKTLVNDLDPALAATAGFQLTLPDINTEPALAKLRADVDAGFKATFNANDVQVFENVATGSLGRLENAALQSSDAFKSTLADIVNIGTSKLFTPEVEANFAKYGKSQADLNRAILGGKDAETEFLNTTNAFAILGGAGIATVDGLTSAAAKAQGEYKSLNLTITDANNLINAYRTAIDASAAATGTHTTFVGLAISAIERQALAALAAASATDGATQAAQDFNAEFPGKGAPLGIGILDKLGITVDQLSGSYKDLTSAVSAAEAEILKELGIPLTKAEAQSKAIADQAQLVEDATNAAGKPVTTTTPTKRNKRTGKVTGGDTVTIPTQPVTLDQAFNQDITGNIAISDQALKVRNDIIAGLKQAETDYVTSISSGNATVDEANAKYSAYIANLEATFGALGITKDAVDGFVAALHATPAEVSTIITAIGLADKVKSTEAYSKLLADLPPDVATAINAATTGDERVKILSGYLNDIKNDPAQTATIKADVLGLADAEKMKETVDGTNSKSFTVAAAVTGDAALSALKAKLDAFKDKTVTVTTRTVSTSNDGTAGGGRSPANGGFVGQFANGGIYAAAPARVPMIATTRGPAAGILWAEPETGWEAYISGKPMMRQRNIGILSETASRFGMRLVPKTMAAPRVQPAPGTISMPTGGPGSSGDVRAMVQQLQQVARQMDIRPLVGRFERIEEAFGRVENAMMTMPPITVTPAAGDPVNAANKMWHHMARRRAEARR